MRQRARGRRSAANPNRRLNSWSARRSRTPSHTDGSTAHSALAAPCRCSPTDTWSVLSSTPVTSPRCASALPSRTARTSTKIVDPSSQSSVDAYIADHIAPQWAADASNGGVELTTADMERTLAATSLGSRTITIRSADPSERHDGIVWLKRGSFSTKGSSGTSRVRCAPAPASGAVGPTKAPSHQRGRGGRNVPSTVSSVARRSSLAALTSRLSKNPFGFSGDAGISRSPARWPARTNASASIEVPLRGAPAMTTEVTC